MGPEGSTMRYAEGGHAKLIVTSGARWSDEAEDVFLDALAASGNVTASASEASFSRAAVYKRRRTYTDFAAKWQAALLQGYARVEMALVRAAADSMEGIEFDAERPIPKMTVDQALNVLKLHAAAAGRGDRRYGAVARPRSLDELRESIVRKVEAIRRARGLAEPQGALPAPHGETPAPQDEAPSQS